LLKSSSSALTPTGHRAIGVRLSKRESVGLTWRARAYLALFQMTSAVVPIDPAGLYHVNSSSESDLMIRLLSMPSKFGYELLSI